jgi:hypothetical protein
MNLKIVLLHPFHAAQTKVTALLNHVRLAGTGITNFKNPVVKRGNIQNTVLQKIRKAQMTPRTLPGRKRFTMDSFQIRSSCWHAKKKGSGGFPPEPLYIINPPFEQAGLRHPLHEKIQSEVAF